MIVIVVIAILAAITIVAYNGIQTRAKASATQSLVTSITKKITSYQAVAGRMPTADELINNYAPGTTVANSGPPEARLESGGVSSNAPTATNGTSIVRYVNQDSACGWLDWWDYNNNRLTTLSTTPISTKIGC